ncbi:hypothetical protein J4H86_12935 [Spiractinospora alimapuensis]|uniref:hypothetical protein n=1 Tax=Spiractinospora alimapuensis TaxID=2820884 RepID=UPI001F321170|nr:hypothetical protein [Spiractinospora alimapuensis]QVQ54486.1 hypothetical protein J4H86_12935 [Spiractinospora alimapuensis]
MATRVVERCAPDELPYYENVRDDVFTRGGRPPRPADNPLGFGAAAVSLVTGVAVGVLIELVTGSLTDILRPWWQRAWLWVRAKLGRRKAAPAADTDAVLPLITPANVASVTKAITTHAVRAGIPPQAAGEIAAAIICELGKPVEAHEPSPDSPEHL